MTYLLVDEHRGETREFDTESDAKATKADLVSLGTPEDHLTVKAKNGDELSDVEVLRDERAAETAREKLSSESDPDTTRDASASHATPRPTEDPVQALGEELARDPLDILPDYMIDDVKGTPTLNKRGLSVLAYQYGVSVEDRTIVVSPHESEWEYAIVETTVTNEDGNRFVGTGTAHVDRGDDREILLELAETRSYKRGVSFATGTGIVSYQELVGELE